MKATEAYVLVGLPGAGKSTLVRALVGDAPTAWLRRPFSHGVHLNPDGTPELVQFGAPHPEFPGTDRLSMAVQPLAVAYATSDALPAPAVLAEGDRLGTDSFLTALRAAGIPVSVVWLDTPSEVCEARRALRSTTPKASWVAGRQTKVKRLVARWWEDVTRVDGLAPLDDQLEALPGLLREIGRRRGR